MRNIVIVGASGLGREVYQWLSDLGEKENIKGSILELLAEWDVYHLMVTR